MKFGNLNVLANKIIESEGITLFEQSEVSKEEREDAIIHFLKKEACDVWNLQEVDNSLSKKIKTELSGYDGHPGDGLEKQVWNYTLYNKSKLQFKQAIPLVNGSMAFVFEGLTVFNCHVPAGEEGKAVRHETIERLADEMKKASENGDVFLSGEFNLYEGDEKVRDPLYNSYNFAPADEKEVTFTSLSSDFEGSPDAAFSNRKLSYEIKDVAVPEKGIPESDHKALIVVFAEEQ